MEGPHSIMDNMMDCNILESKYKLLSHYYIYFYPTKYGLNWHISIVVRVFTNGLGDQSSILGQVMPKTQKIILDASWLNTQHLKVWVKCK